MTTTTTYRVILRRPHAQQAAFIDSTAKRVVIRSGRRSGKTVGVAVKAVKRFLAGGRVLYAAPTQEQVDAFWYEVKRALAEPIDANIYYKNESLHVIELPGTKQRIRAKTAWNADTLRGDYADLLILDEWQLMSEDAWESVGAPMLLDNDGDAVFIYTPPSMYSKSVTKARDPRHASKMFEAAKADTTGRWAAFHFTSHDNPYISTVALEEITRDMTSARYRQEILAEDLDEIPGALWTRKLIERSRVAVFPSLLRIVVGVDPPGGATECGIVCGGRGGDGHIYIIDDRSLQGSPETWANAVIDCYEQNEADRVVGEANYGGDMVENTIRQVAKGRQIEVSYKNVHASRGKAVRAEPVVAAFEQGRVHLAGSFPMLEDELVSWVPGETTASPNRLDAMVWMCTELLSGAGMHKSDQVRTLGSQRRKHPLGLDPYDPRVFDIDAPVNGKRNGHNN